MLYELFTGQRAFEAKNVAELLRKREAGIVPPSQLVRDLDPAIERAILRCLEHDPARPPVLGARGGGGAARRRPARGGAGGRRNAVAGDGGGGRRNAARCRRWWRSAGLLVTLLFLVAYAALSDIALVTRQLPLEKSPEVLADRAREVSRRLGYDDAPVDFARNFSAAADYLRYAREKGEGPATRQRLRTGRPPGLLFWHRTSPRPMVPTGGQERVTTSDPPMTITNMRTVVLDSEGRLVEFHAVPPQLDRATDATHAAPDWSRLFDLASLAPGDFHPVAPQWTPPTFADQRMAWEGPMPGWPEQTVRLEAGAYRGRIVFFQTVNPWTEPTAMREEPRSRAQRWSQGFVAIVVLVVLIVAAGVARHNLRKGRGDVRGAFRISTVVFVTTLGDWLIRAKHFSNPNVQLDRVFTAIGWALFSAGALWVLYLALEPYVRKFWPSTLISWSRLLAGRYRDAQVGRDVLIGVFVATAVLLVGSLDFFLRPVLGYPALPPVVPNLETLSGARPVLALALAVVFDAAFNSLWIIFALVAVNLLVRRIWITAIVMVGFLMLTGLGGIDGPPPLWLRLSTALIILSAIVYVMLRFGLLTTMTFFAVNFLINSAVLTLDSSRWFFSTSATVMAIVAALALYGFYASREASRCWGGGCWIESSPSSSIADSQVPDPGTNSQVQIQLEVFGILALDRLGVARKLVIGSGWDLELGIGI